MVITVYTDGSCHGNPGPGGYAAVIHGEAGRIEISGGFALTTNNRMEIMGAVAALESLHGASQVVLYSDSTYLVNAMRGGWPQAWRAHGWRRRKNAPARNADLWARLLELCEVHQVTFRHLRGHRDNRENNRCDELANAVASRTDLPPDPGYPGRQQQPKLL
jgi:ribonuclease HI